MNNLSNKNKFNNKSTNLQNIDDKFDVVIVGGGIVGAGIFRDLSLHGVKTLIIDKCDFASQTSQYSSKMFHGGIRYLETFNFGLVWEALHEKNLWLKLAPHLCKEMPFFMPIFKESKDPLWMVDIGLTLYDALSGFQNSNHSTVSREETIDKLPYIKEENLRGSGIYYDVIVDDSKITLENIYDGLIEEKSFALNYVELESMDIKSDSNISIKLHDRLTNAKRTIIAKDIVFATGPFTDNLLTKFKDLNWTPKLLPSKGSHIWIKKSVLPLNNPVVLRPKDNRIVFVIPHEHAVLVGTTEIVVSGDLFDLKPSADEILYLLNNLNEFFPTARITTNDILSSFAGVRPLVKLDESSDAHKTARNHKIFNPKNNIHVIVGGKLTTYRVMGQPICKKIVSKNSIKYNPNKTKNILRRQSIFPAFSSPNRLTNEMLPNIIQNELVRTFDDLLIRRLSGNSCEYWDKISSDIKSLDLKNIYEKLQI